MTLKQAWCLIRYGHGDVWLRLDGGLECRHCGRRWDGSSRGGAWNRNRSKR